MSSQNKARRSYILAVICFLLVVGFTMWKQGLRHKSPSPPTNNVISAATNSGHALTSPDEAGLRALTGSFRSSTNADFSRQSLEELRARFSRMPTAEAVAEIRRYLDSKSDAPTHLGFKIAANGLLDEAPTLRTFLLDELARLDPAAAADYAKTILSSKDSPDEWAVALRNLARGDSSSAARDLLTQKMADMLAYEPWQKDPSIGYLEAFDTAVYLGGTNLLSPLTALVRKQDNPAVAHAAFLSLDRMVIDDPATTLDVIASSPDMMKGREATRANYLARADVRDPKQRQILESYLLNPNINPSELATFAGVYPNMNFMVSHNLLTQTQPPDGAGLSDRDSQSLAIVQQWLGDPRFSNVNRELQMVSQRLQGFVHQSKGQ